MTTALTLTDALALLKAGDVSSAELVRRALEAADDRDAELGVFVTRFADTALEAARDADRQRLPLGAQIIGRPFADRDALAVGAAYQRVVDWHLRIPVESAPTCSDGTMPARPASALPSDPALAAGLVEMLGILPSPEDSPDVYGALDFMRRNAEVLRGVEAADRVDPLATFPPLNDHPQQRCSCTLYAPNMVDSSRKESLRVSPPASI